MRKSEGLMEKLFGSLASNSSRVPLRSNIHGGGFSHIGQTGGGAWSQRGARNSPLLGNSGASNLISGYYDRAEELRQYYLLDITKLAVSFFSDYIINFLSDSNQQVVSILREDGGGSVDEEKTEKLNEILLKDLKIFDYIKDHVADYVFWGQYTSLLCKSIDELGHQRFRFEELYDPISTITKKKKNKEGGMDETFLTRGEDGKLYEIASTDAFTLGNVNLRLINDLESNYKNTAERPELSTDGINGNLNKVMRTCSYAAGEPLFYSLVMKMKDLVTKERLIPLISLRDIASTQVFLLQFDKSTPIETAKELCARTTKLANNTNELASFQSSQFDVESFIENTLTNSAKFVPDYNATLGNKNNLLPLDKLSDKLLDLMQTIDATRNSILSPLGIPGTILDSTSGSKWAILQQSERANSKVASFMSGIKSSVMDLVRILYKSLYNKDIDSSLVRLHVSEKTSVEYNNQINQSESINGLVQGIGGVIGNAVQLLDQVGPLIDPKAFMNYVQNKLKDIDSDTESIITEDTIEAFVAYTRYKIRSAAEQNGISPEDLEKIAPSVEERQNV